MYKIAVVGDKDSVLCFRAFGASVYETSAGDYTAARRTVDRLAAEGCGVIFLTEQLAQGLAETLARYRRETTPAIVLIPSGVGSLGIGLRTIRENVEKAVGINVLES